MKSRRFSIFFGAWLAGTSVGYAADLDSFLLLNDKGKQLPVSLPRDDKPTPLGVLIWVAEGEIAAYCNGVHGYKTKERNFFLTARHCLEVPRNLDKAERFVIYFSNRSGKQRALPVKEKPVAFSSVPEGQKARYDLDFAALPLPADEVFDWDAIDVFEKPLDTGKPLTLWYYDFESEEDKAPTRAKLKKLSCDGTARRAPEFSVDLVGPDKPLYSTQYYLSHSKQGRKLDEAYGVFFENCAPNPASSGALITDESGNPIGLVHSVLTTSTFLKTWEAGLNDRFEKNAREAVGEKFPTAPKHHFAFLPNSGKSKRREISLDRTDTFYGVAALFSEIKKTGADFFRQLTE